MRTQLNTLHSAATGLKSHWLIVLTLLFSILCSIEGEERIWDWELISSYGFGTTEYNLKLSNSTESVRSLLIFPVDGLYLGIAVTENNPTSLWKWYFSMNAALTDPTNKMTDEDWINLPVSNGKHYYSYTESNLEADAFSLSAAPQYLLLKNNFSSLFIAGSYNLLYFSQIITDYEGYKLDDTDLDGTYDTRTTYTPYSGEALDYWILYHIVDLGVTWQIDFGHNFTSFLSAAPSVGLFYDRDDHLLRTKLSTANGLGYGFSTSAGIKYTGHGFKGKGWDPYITLFFSYRWFYSDGLQRQYWYGNADPEAPQGTLSTGIPHEITLQDPRISVSIGAHFGS